MDPAPGRKETYDEYMQRRKVNRDEWEDRRAAGMGFARLVFVIAVGITSGLALNDVFRFVLGAIWKLVQPPQ